MNTRGRSLLIVSLILVAVAIAIVSRTTAASEPAVTGELVETFCWARIRVGGPSHAACGIECAKRGIPLAVFDATTHKAYVLLPGRDKTSLPPELIAAMGTKVSIHGELLTRGGAQFVTVNSWKKK